MHAGFRTLLPVSLAIFATFSLLPGCAYLKSKAPAGLSPEIASETGAQYDTAVIFATSDLRGSLLPIENGHGGAALLEGYYKAVRKDFGSRVVWLDAGNLRGKSLDYGFDGGASFETFVRGSGLLVTLGTPTAPQVSPGKLLLTSDSAMPGEESNPRSLYEGHRFEIVEAGKLRLGIVSASSARDLGTQAQAARAQGAQLVIWLSDLPIRCNPNMLVQHVSLRRPGEPNGFCEGAIRDIVASLPEGTINAVIASGDGRPLERFIYPRYSSNPLAGVPVVEASPFGRDFHVIYLAYDPKSGKPVFAKTRIEGPVPVKEGVFHGREIGPDRATLSLTRPAQKWLTEEKQNVLAKSLVNVTADSERESELGDLVADALRSETRSDYAIVQPGITKYSFGRIALAAGPISRFDLQRAIPMDSPVAVISVSGEELKTLVRISENGSRGFSSVSGMKLRLIRPDRDAPATDLDGDHAVSLWERNRILELTDLEDDPIQTRKTYRLAVPRHLLEGGDDWNWASRHYDLPQRVTAESYPSARELVAQYLKGLGKLEGIPSRIRFENPPGRHHRRRKHRTRRRHHRRNVKT